VENLLLEAMRRYFYSPEAIENLATFKATDAEFKSIDAQVAGLAGEKDTKPGYRIPFQDPLLDPSKSLYRHQVGRFQLNYIFDKDELEVVSVMI
jgi:hypothetical protein